MVFYTSARGFSVEENPHFFWGLCFFSLPLRGTLISEHPLFAGRPLQRRLARIRYYNLPSSHFEGADETERDVSISPLRGTLIFLHK